MPLSFLDSIISKILTFKDLSIRKPSEKTSTIFTYNRNSRKRFHLKDNTKHSIKIMENSSLVHTDLANLNDSSLIFKNDRLSMYITIYVILKFTGSFDIKFKTNFLIKRANIF